METEKTCNRCKETKPLTEYDRHKSRDNEPYATCKECNRKKKFTLLTPEEQARVERFRNQKALGRQGLKQCLTCDEIKNISEFSTQTGKVKYSHCSCCRPLLDKEYTRSNPTRQESRHASLYAKRELAAAYTLPFKEKGCADCGRYIPEAMDFDHTCPPSEKTINISNIYKITGSNEEMLAALALELTKGEYVCANCHRLRTVARMEYSSRLEYLSNPQSSRLSANTKHIYSVLSKASCSDCSEKNFLLLEFDHVRGTKIANLSKMMRSTVYTWEEVQEEMSKCEARCINCHRVRTRARQSGKEATEQGPTKSQTECECGLKKSRTAKMCAACHATRVADKVKETYSHYGDLDALVERLRSSNFTRVGKELGVSGSAIRKHLRRNGIDPKSLCRSPVVLADKEE